MNRDRVTFELPKGIDRYLAALNELYKQQGRTQLQEIIVNADVRVHEEWSRDNWDGGTYGHALYLAIPQPIYLSCVDQKDDLQNQIKADLNNIHNVQREFVEEVFLEMQPTEDRDWRMDSGLRRSRTRTVVPETEQRLWGDLGFRLFLSHKAEHKKQATELKWALSSFGVTCFVAHEDIEPTKEWQDEIEAALFSMDALAALMTEGFFESVWTNQELGVAFGRGTPVILLREGSDPRGFVGKYQAVSRRREQDPKQVAEVLYDLLWKDKTLHQKLIESLVIRLETATSFQHGIEASKQLKDRLTSPHQCSPGLLARIEKAVADERYVRDAYYVPQRLRALLTTLRTGPRTGTIEGESAAS